MEPTLNQDQRFMVSLGATILVALAFINFYENYKQTKENKNELDK